MFLAFLYFFLSKTKVAKARLEFLRVLIFSHCFIVDRVGLSGGLALMCMDVIDISWQLFSGPC